MVGLFKTGAALETYIATDAQERNFQSVKTSRLMYGLSSAWWNVTDQRRLDGFQARCLRRITGIKPSFVMRVSNSDVRTIANDRQYSKQLLQQQLLLYGRVARAQDSDLFRSLTFG